MTTKEEYVEAHMRSFIQGQQSIIKSMRKQAEKLRGVDGEKAVLAIADAAEAAIQERGGK